MNLKNYIRNICNEKKMIGYMFIIFTVAIFAQVCLVQ